jgi:DNA processing protein
VPVDEKKQYVLALSMIKGLGPVSVKSLIAYCGGPKEVFEMPRGKLMRAPGIGEKAAQLVKDADTLRRAETEMARCEKEKVGIVSYLDQDYPHLLKYIHDAPLVLFRKGQVNLNAQPNLAIVGTRKPTDHGREIAETFATFFAEQGINVVSGLAYGIDIAAHRATLQSKGITTAVLGHGLDMIYPSTHWRKAEEMLSRGGLLTEYPIGTQPEAVHFPARNRIVAGLSRAVIVVEAAESGGALITARMAFDQNREVYAIPGRLNDTRSQGCNLLIRNQIARLVTDPHEILEDLEIRWKQVGETDPERPSLPAALPEGVALSPDEAKVMNFLERGEALVDQITHHTGIHISRLNALLLSMEFKGLLKQAPGKKFRRI